MFEFLQQGDLQRGNGIATENYITAGYVVNNAGLDVINNRILIPTATAFIDIATGYPALGSPSSLNNAWSGVPNNSASRDISSMWCLAYCRNPSSTNKLALSIGNTAFGADFEIYFGNGTTDKIGSRMVVSGPATFTHDSDVTPEANKIYSILVTRVGNTIWKIHIDGVDRSTTPSGTSANVFRYSPNFIRVAGAYATSAGTLDGGVLAWAITTRTVISVGEAERMASSVLRKVQIPVSWNPDPGVQNASIAHGPYPLVARPSVSITQKSLCTTQPMDTAADPNWLLFNAADGMVSDFGVTKIAIHGKRAYDSVVNTAGTFTDVPLSGKLKIANDATKPITIVGVLTRDSTPNFQLRGIGGYGHAFILQTIDANNVALGVAGIWWGVWSYTANILLPIGKSISFAMRITWVSGNTWSRTTCVNGVSHTGTYTGDYADTLGTLRVVTTPGIAMIGAIQESLSDSQLLDLSRNPWQLLKPRALTQPFPGPRRKLM